ncbi:hypothetical protein ACREYJ_17270 [Pseudomonas kribbensis]|uniref:hypothetical protein n=1 Tax=Pseudomonas kribbensis TaxID=1628086 RepID=UPI003D787D05
MSWAHGDGKGSVQLLIGFKDPDRVADEVTIKKMKGRVSMGKGIFRKLAEEFWLPLLCAIGWVVYSGWGKPFSVQDTITHFSGSFFFVSYMTAQYFRVRKQARMEASVTTLTERLEKMIDDFQEKTLWTINHITGGDSYCFAEPQLSRPSYAGIRWDVKNCGVFPLYQVTAKIHDLDRGSTLPNGFLQTRSEEVFLGDIPCEATRFFDWDHFGSETTRNYTITFDSRNGKIIQDVRIKLVDGNRDVAFRLTKDGEMPVVIKEVIPEHFPRDENGHFDWSAPTPKPPTFTGWVSPI